MRESYQYQKQSPSDHIENLQCHLRIASSLVPEGPSFSHFRIRHPDLQETNIVVSESSESGLQIVSVLDWQHTSIPHFPANMPQRLQNYDDRVSQSMTWPSLLENLGEASRSYTKELHRRRLVH